MATALQEISRREPVDFAAGDSLVFIKALRNFPASKGWSLEYELFNLAGGPAVANFVSVALGDDHSVDVYGFAAGFQQGQYELFGYAVNAGERHQIYQGEFNIGADGTSAGIKDQSTHAQRMIPLLEQKLERLEAMDFSETDVQRNRFVIEQRNDTRRRLNEYREERANEIQRERVKNGRPAGDKARAVFAIGA